MFYIKNITHMKINGKEWIEFKYNPKFSIDSSYSKEDILREKYNKYIKEID